MHCAKWLRNSRSKRLISQSCKNLPSAWSDLLEMAVTPSFQLRIVHRLNHWIVDFLRFEMDQQTLILREIQQHLGLLPPAPPISPVPSEPFASADDFDPADDATPVAIPSTVAAEDLSYPPEEPTT
ncbi:hypothetical protein VitviT2T_008547 [Vitis vinifera]|uniref:Uncharacterized protein n=1 Tax=Vitis vinifera TaxID=29760 RepID=A0ABY9C3Q8_VITVI|nr:hypothetical protein VitviT2T_008547 [Vitis vinifera]